MKFFVAHSQSRLWKLQVFFNETKVMSSHLQVAFRREVNSANSFANILTKQGVDKVVPLVDPIV